MKEEEKKAQQTVQTAEAPKTEPAKNEDDPKKKEPNEEPETEPNEEPKGEDPNEEPKGEEPAEEPKGEDPNEEPAEEPKGEDPNEEPATEPNEPEDDPKKKKDDDPDDKCGGGEPKKGDNANDALRNAESLVAERDKTIKAKDSKIAELQKQLEEKSKDNSKNLVAIADRDKNIKALTETVAELKKQVSELRGEVKELAAEPAPMTNDEAGVPKDNGTGAVMTGAVKSIVTSDMSADEIRERLRKQDKEMAEKRRRR